MYRIYHVALEGRNKARSALRSPSKSVLTARGIAGGTAGVSVVNDHTGPGVEPAELIAVTCQKYVVSAASVPGLYDALVSAGVIGGGGLLVPNPTA
jgi:hypothetical protein